MGWKLKVQATDLSSKENQSENNLEYDIKRILWQKSNSDRVSF